MVRAMLAGDIMLNKEFRMMIGNSTIARLSNSHGLTLSHPRTYLFEDEETNRVGGYGGDKTRLLFACVAYVMSASERHSCPAGIVASAHISDPA